MARTEEVIVRYQCENPACKCTVLESREVLQTWKVVRVYAIEDNGCADLYHVERSALLCPDCVGRLAPDMLQEPK